MLFNGQEQEKKVNSCSGGEKHRMMLSKIMLEQGNFLVLDEPTNHLDLPSIEELENVLNSYQGAIIYVSHDSFFVKNLVAEVLKISK